MADRAHSTSRRTLLAASLAFTAAPASASFDAAHPDAELVRLCEEHVANLRAFLAVTDYATPEDEDNCPIYAAWARTTRLIEQAKPRTMVGILAKARAALAEARPEEGSASFHASFCFTSHEWAWQLLNDLARIHGIEVEDPRPPI